MHAFSMEIETPQHLHYLRIRISARIDVYARMYSLTIQILGICIGKIWVNNDLARSE